MSLQMNIQMDVMMVSSYYIEDWSTSAYSIKYPNYALPVLLGALYELSKSIVYYKRLRII